MCDHDEILHPGYCLQVMLEMISTPPGLGLGHFEPDFESLTLASALIKKVS